jgi:hypothetical protein
MLKDLVLKLVGPVSILIEAYRIFNGTLLVIFVPGVCGGRACLPQQNFENGSTVYRINCGFNLAALLTFMILYAVEIKREYTLNTYLRVNPELPSDLTTVKAAFTKLTIERQNSIHSLDWLYQRAIRFTILVVCINTVLSGYVIMTEYANDKGPTLFATGTILIATKIYNILTVGTYEGYVSAYVQKRMEFNDAQPSKCVPDQTALPLEAAA